MWLSLWRSRYARKGIAHDSAKPSACFMTLALFSRDPPAYASTQRAAADRSNRCFSSRIKPPGPRSRFAPPRTRRGAGEPQTVVRHVYTRKQQHRVASDRSDRPRRRVASARGTPGFAGPQPQDYTFAVKPGTILDQRGKRREAFAGVRPYNDDDPRPSRRPQPLPPKCPSATVRPVRVVRSPKIEEAGREYTLRRVPLSQ